MPTRIEQELIVAFAQQAASVPDEAVQRVRAVDYRPRRHRLSRRVLIAGSAGSATIAGSVAALVLAGAQPAFAGWSAQPSAAGDAAGSAQCLGQLSNAAPPGGGSNEQWTAALTDNRGPYQLSVYSSTDGASATCFTGPDFATVSMLRGSGAGAGSLRVGSAGTSQGSPQSGSSSQTLSQGSGPVTQVDTGHFTLNSDGPYTTVVGQVASDATSVTLVRSDGQDVTATLGAGEFAAWWPGDADVTAAQVVTPDGTTTEPLSPAPSGP